MPTYTSHILQLLDVSCFSPLKKVCSSQIENKIRLSINHITVTGGGMPKVFIGLNQGLTKAGEEGVGIMNTVRCNHCSRYMS
jgi:hypothetical protein